MSETAAQDGASPAPPASALEAHGRLNALVADKGWAKKLLDGDVNAGRDFRNLSSMAASEDDSQVEAAMSGNIGDMPDSSVKLMASTAEMLRTIGIEDGAIRQTLSGYEVSQVEVDAVTAWKTRSMKSPEWVKRYVSGEPDEVKAMTLANIVLSSGVKKQEAA